MSDEKPISIPDLVDEPIHFLIWQFDEIILLGVGLIFGIIINSPLLGILLGIISTKQYLKLRDGKPRGYFLHRFRELGIAFEKNNKHCSLQPPLVDKYHS